jgi:hypothetical protein
MDKRNADDVVVDLSEIVPFESIEIDTAFQLSRSMTMIDHAFFLEFKRVRKDGRKKENDIRHF